jgi:hypothetical protein
MAKRFQVAFDCADPGVLVTFWSAALGYVPEPPPEEFESWRAYFKARGVPDDELEGMTDEDVDSAVDPDGVGPRLWFQLVPEGKQVKNRLHLDVDVTKGRGVDLAIRRDQVHAEAERLVSLGAKVNRVLHAEGSDHYAITMYDPEGNEFCIR